MPPTGRRRRNKEPEQRVDADDADTTTPSRKRRRVNGSSNANAVSAASRNQRASAESDATIDNQEGDSSSNMDEAPEYKEAEAIIQRLRTAHYQVGVSIDYNNSIVPPNEQAYAKIAGRNWTYYVKDTSVVIGRPNNKPKREPVEEAGGTPVGVYDHGMMVNIDLGPDQQISRIHAEIYYESNEQKWFIRCNGRNGLHLDDMRLERGYVCALRSGMVISILGTQMIFILPNEPPEIHPVIRRSLLEDGDGEDEQYQPGDGAPKGTNVRLGGPPGNSYQGTSYPRTASGSGTQAAHALAALSSSQQAPGTPNTRPQPPLPKSKNSPAYTVKGVMIESTDEIDYSADSAKDIKPPHSYAQMIGQAILSREGENATLAQIYEFIKDHYAYFRHGGGGWQNSIRHNLSLSKHFEKIPRRTDEPGKGMKWQIVPEFREEYMKKNFHENRRPQRRLDSSGPNSPAMTGPGVQTERLVGALNADSTRIKRQSGSPTPPRHSYPAPNESFTPDRGPRNMQLQTGQLPSANGGAPVSAASELLTPTFDRANPLASQQTYSAGSRQGEALQNSAVDSPPTLTASGYDAVGNSNVFTPLPARQAPKPHLLSTIKPPSFYAKELFSSPAPFWKFAEIPGSTPLRPMADFSPGKFPKPAPADDEIKTDQDEPIEREHVPKKEEDDDVDDKAKVLASASGVEAESEPMLDEADPEAEIPPPSSPLGNKIADGLDQSPSRTVSRPVSRREPSSMANTVANGIMSNAPKLAPPPAQPKFNISAVNAPSFRMFGPVNGDLDEDDDEGIDLSKNSFQKIGQYHRVLNAARPTAPR
ncbi:uncharacterized protein PV09_02695 [Verruconis gallopava]|uniref:Fork-head domain-containing protein n=1 Tax=Verruconis gallopava TaxID=253628 RepID=A0A0D2B4Q4_9PEZI|nr:uncharacterized protein PV09_02695 [Verruconis gallopava]KIW06219.1 hypothetical protein PV09_02695 [Verruconis gallopava]